MKNSDFNKLIKDIKANSPLIHCITNPISINECANAILSLGAKPIMAEHPEEAEEITKTCKALMLNLGNITDVRMKSMLISAKTANSHNIPFIIDLVGIACSSLRRRYAKNLLSDFSATVIKGNYSEINALSNSDYHSCGVDSENLDINYMNKIAVDCALKHNAIILASGKTDIITDGKQLFHNKSGTKKLSSVTGTGCMLGALCACFLSSDNSILSAIAACAFLGICGEKAENDKGSYSFLHNLMDNLSTITDINNDLHMEEIIIKNE